MTLFKYQLRKVALKSAPAISDENQISILNLSEAVMKPVTSTMSLWSEMMVNFNTQGFISFQAE